MPRLTHLGPSIIVLLAVGATLFGGPMVIRKVMTAKSRVDVVQAANRLAQGNILAEFSAATRDIAIVVEPSVVHVSTRGPLSRNRGINRQFASSGSGWIWDEEGHIVTNAHVVDGAELIEIQLHDGEIRAAEVVELDLRSDIAVVKISSGDLIPASLGSSRELHQGDLVFAFGSPFNFRFSMSSGIVSGLGRAAGLEDIDYENFIQVDAAINPGNSGGPLTDVYGRVVGMNTAIATGNSQTIGQGQFAGVGLAIPMSMIKNVVEQVIETGEIRKGYMGVSLIETQPGQSDVEGVEVIQVVEGSPADLAGVLIGDVIVHVEGRRVKGLEQLRSMISSRRPGEETRIGIWRRDPSSAQADQLELLLILGELDPSAGSNGGGLLKKHGLRELARSTPELAASLGVTHSRGVLVVKIDPRRALGSRLPVGTLITTANGRSIGSVDALHARIDHVVEVGGRLVGFRGPFIIEAILPDGENVSFDLREVVRSSSR